MILEILWSFRPIRRFRTCSAVIQFLSCYFINRLGYLGGQVFLIKIHQRSMSVWEKFTALSELISSSYFKRNNRIAMVFWNADFRWGQCVQICLFKYFLPYLRSESKLLDTFFNSSFFTIWSKFLLWKSNLFQRPHMSRFISLILCRLLIL